MPSWEVTFDLHIATNDSKLVTAVARADALSSIVRGIPLPPNVYYRLDSLNISRAVRGTTGIEGSDLSEDEVAQVLRAGEESVLGAGRAREEKEARNAAAVMRFVAETIAHDADQPLSEALIKEIHRLTTEGIEYTHNEPGKYRLHSVTAGDYSPPRDPDQVAELMSQFVEWLNHGPGNALPPAVRAIAAHFYFISIHPFGDGNGRTARAIESYLLYQGQINVVGFYSLSNFYYRQRANYIEMLDYVRFKSGGSLTPFIQFALDGLVEELELVRREVIRAVNQIVYRDFARAILETQSPDARSRMNSFLQLLDGTSASISDIRQGRHPLAVLYVNVSPRTLSRDLRFLEEKELIRRESGTVRLNFDVMNRFAR